MRNQEIELAKKRAKNSILSTWEKLAEEYTLGWVYPIEAAIERYPHIEPSTARLGTSLRDDLPVVVYQTRESPPEEMVAAIPYYGGCRLLASKGALEPEEIELINGFTQAFWFLMETRQLPHPTESNTRLERRIVQLTGKKLISID